MNFDGAAFQQALEAGDKHEALRLLELPLQTLIADATAQAEAPGGMQAETRDSLLIVTATAVRVLIWRELTRIPGLF